MSVLRRFGDSPLGLLYRTVVSDDDGKSKRTSPCPPFPGSTESRSACSSTTTRHIFMPSMTADEAVVEIETGQVLRGRLPRTAQRLVREWALSHREELLENWRRGRDGVGELL